jgi:peptidoglycan/LPS O-acetylase OafA/YrhL
VNYLTSIRGIAAILVMFYHIKHFLLPYLPEIIMTVIQMGYLAVDFFFVLSGFILTWKYQSVFKKPTLAIFYDFFVKRVARIYPLHVITLLFFATIPLALVVTGREVQFSDRFSLDSLPFHFFLIQNWGWSNIPSWNVPSWSISTELFAYLSLPLGLYVINRLNRVTLIILLLSIYLFSIIYLNMQGVESLAAVMLGFPSIVRCIYGFYFGVFTALVAPHVKNHSSGVFFILALSVLIAVTTYKIEQYYYVPALFSLILLALLGSPKIVHKGLECRPILYLGEISFSIYLLHYVVRDQLTMYFLPDNSSAPIYWIVIYIVVTIGLSAISYKYIEIALKNFIIRKAV